MKFRAKRQTARTMTPEQEAAMVLRQRDNLLKWLAEREKWCFSVSISEVRGFFPIDPHEDSFPPYRYGSSYEINLGDISD